MDKVIYCMGCGLELATEKYCTYCINPKCWMYALLVARSFTNPPSKQDLRTLRLTNPSKAVKEELDNAK